MAGPRNRMERRSPLPPRSAGTKSSADASLRVIGSVATPPPRSSSASAFASPAASSPDCSPGTGTNCIPRRPRKPEAEATVASTRLRLRREEVVHQHEVLHAVRVRIGDGDAERRRHLRQPRQRPPAMHREPCADHHQPKCTSSALLTTRSPGGLLSINRPCAKASKPTMLGLLGTATVCRAGCPGLQGTSGDQ